MHELYTPQELAALEEEAHERFLEYGPSYSGDDAEDAGSAPRGATESAPEIAVDGKTARDLAAEFGIVCPADYQDEDVQEREWWIDGLVPVGQVTLLYGDGGVGKSLLALQWALAASVGKETLGHAPQAGRVFYLGAEDAEDEFKRRQLDICKALGVRWRDLEHFALWPLAGQDAVMALPDTSKRMVPTEVFRKAEAYARVFRPRCIVLDTAADLFGGNEVDRAQVRQFVGMLRRIAIDVRCAVILLAHPSVSGMMSGTGTSGSTGWSNSARSRLYLTRPAGDDEDPDMRVLKVMKSNYGKIGGEAQIRWERGAFVLNSGSSSRMLADARAERVFMDCLHEVENNIGRVTFAVQSQAYYAPKVFSQMPRADGISMKLLERAMESLRRAGRITEINHGTQARPMMGITARHQ